MLWPSLFPDLLPFAVGVSEPAAERALRIAATEFFRRTKVWKVWLPEIVVVDGQQAYDLVLPAGSMVEEIRQATLNGMPVDVRSADNFSSDPALHPDQGPGVASPDRIRLVLAHRYGAGQRVQVQAVLTCSDLADGAPDALLVQHRDAVVDGAKGRLLIEPGKPFTDANSAAIASGRFEAAVASVAAKAYRGFTGDMPRHRPQWC